MGVRLKVTLVIDLNEKVGVILDDLLKNNEDIVAEVRLAKKKIPGIEREGQRGGLSFDGDASGGGVVLS